MIEFRKRTATKGIEKCHPAELPAEFYNVTNRWSGSVNGKLIIIYAGSLRHNPAKGVLVMRTLPDDSKRIAGKHCTVPTNRGSLFILESQGTRLLIGMADGGSFWFEIPNALRHAA
ncbi:MAG TPA: hypothetical protein VEJ41_04170 [Candidatus Acidoferrales bacterium]|nr:hypothetical protein [Candidatus Acidoferrales bacterium]